MELVLKFYKVGNRHLDTYAGTLAATKVCLRLLEKVGSVRCENWSECVQDNVPLLVDVYTEYVLSPDLDISRSEKAIETRNVFVKDGAGLVSGP